MKVMIKSTGAFEVNCEPEYLVSDKDFLKILNSPDVRKDLLTQMNKEEVIVGRLGTEHNGKFFSIFDKNKLHDLVSSISQLKKVGYYARLWFRFRFKLIRV